MEVTRRSFLAGLGGTVGFGLAGRAAMAATAPAKATTVASANIIQVRAKPKAIQGTLKFAGQTYDCMVGQYGIASPKYEGDGCTPAGLFHMREVRYRADRLTTPPQSGLPVFKSKPSDGWCDDPEDVAYNRIVTLPYQSDAEPMWRDDHLYDVLGVIGYNDAPVVAGAGSAIFLHVMRPPTDDHQYTAGCVSMKIEDVLAVLAKCTPSTMIDIRAVA
jgi:L,D-peptidoglycan transpeptidase YkuD (ErfK/YbiS/YcfS/YnhG family)